MRDLASVSSSSWADLDISHLPAPNHQTTGQSYTIKRYQSPVGCPIEVSSAGAACCPMGQLGTTHHLLLLGVAAPSFSCPPREGDL